MNTSSIFWCFKSVASFGHPQYLLRTSPLSFHRAWNPWMLNFYLNKHFCPKSRFWLWGRVPGLGQITWWIVLTKKIEGPFWEKFARKSINEWTMGVWVHRDNWLGAQMGSDLEPNTACCIWRVISSISNLNRWSSSWCLFCHVPLKRDQLDWEWRLRYWDAMTLVAGSIFRPLSQTHISNREFKNGHISGVCSVFQVIQVLSSAKFFSAEEVDLSFNSETKEHPQISNPSFWKRDRENVFLQMF